jgi:hypothetical protein
MGRCGGGWDEEQRLQPAMEGHGPLRRRVG